MSLQTGCRCKIVKTKEFPAKSSRIRSYAMIRPLLAAFWQTGSAGTTGEKLLRMIVRLASELLCKGSGVRKTRRFKFVVSHPFAKNAKGRGTRLRDYRVLIV
jgi:hypothetical protein